MVKFQGINCRQTCWRATCISSGGSASWCRWRKKSHLCIMEKENCLLKCSLLTKHIHRQNSFSLFILLCFHSSSSSDSELATKHYLKEKKKLPQLKILPPPPNHTLFFTQAASQLVPLALSLYSPAQQTPVRTRSGKYMGQDATARVTHDGELVLWEEYFTWTELNLTSDLVLCSLK